jgi:predicted DNA-binding ArsR family transcriptional regulator|tara:strand:- start:198 stop:344 length:147 start_codon:yes stop_codon:yes gene_type:complete
MAKGFVRKESFDQKIGNQPLRTGIRRLKKKKIKESKWKKFLRWIKNEK